MPDLAATLHDHDPGFLRIIAEHWGLELDFSSATKARQDLISAMLDASLLQEMFETLPEQARQAILELQAASGRIPWTKFQRRYGELREIGQGRRDRERPDLSPISASEILYYRGLLATHFFSTPEGLLEYAVLPDDILALLPPVTSTAAAPPGRSAILKERHTPRPAIDWILDDATTLLAWLRLPETSANLIGSNDFEFPWTIHTDNLPALQSLLQSAGIISPLGVISPDDAKAFLEAGRPDALLTLAQSWLKSTTCNDLAHVPGLVLEGEWKTDPLRAREVVFSYISRIPAGTWWSLSAFLHGVYTTRPDFQRPAGDFDSWYVRDRVTGEYLSGFNNWFRVDGAFLTYLITGPFFWLGFLDLASPASNTTLTAFRKSRWWDSLIANEPPTGLSAETEKFLLNSDARIRVPRLAPRSARYQLARFARWGPASDEAYRFSLTPGSLEAARKQNLSVANLLALLRKNAGVVPPSLVKALERWETRGIEARVEQVLILRLTTPEMLQQVRKSRAARFLGDPLGPTTIIVHSGAAEKVLAVLAELGLLGEVAGLD